MQVSDFMLSSSRYAYRRMLCRSGTAVLQPSVQFILTFSNVQASAVTQPAALQALVSTDLQTYVGSNALAKLAEVPMASGQNWALNTTVFLEPDTMSQVTHPVKSALHVINADCSHSLVSRYLSMDMVAECLPNWTAIALLQNVRSALETLPEQE